MPMNAIAGLPAPDDSAANPRRIDYYDDPNASKANRLVPSVNVVTDRVHIGLIRRTSFISEYSDLPSVTMYVA